MTRRTSARVRQRFAGDGGSSDALGLALLAPAAIGLALVILFLGRGVDSRATVQSAAESAAQAAAQERSLGAARAAATAIGAAMLIDASTCSSPSVELHPIDFRPGGRLAVSVSCTVSAAGLELIRPPAPAASTAVAYATIDPHRGMEGAP